MVFLNPTILFGLLAASIPVLIHMLNLRKLKKVEFSTLSFLKELQKTKIRRIKFKQWFLLALRILIIIFLVASFARPALKSTAIGTASAAKTSAVMILDNSYSMSLVVSEGSNFNKAKEVLRDLLQEFNEGDEVSLILTSSRNDESSDFTTDFYDMGKEINEAEIGMIKNPLEISIGKGIEILNQSKNFNKEIYIFSDLQKNDLDKKEIEIPQAENIHLYLVDFDMQDVDNIAATEFDFENQIFEAGRKLNFTGRVYNSSNNSKSSFASLFTNGERSAQAGFSINQKETETLNFETNLTAGGLVEFMMELEDDDIAYDNNRYLSLKIPDQYNVLLLYNDTRDSKFVELALSNSSNINLKKSKIENIPSININENDVVILIGNEAGKISKLSDYVESGGNIIIFPGSKSEPQEFNNVLTQFDLPNINSSVGNKGGNSIASFGNVELTHPIFSNIFEKEDVEIESPEIYFYLDVSQGSKGKRIIILSNNSSFLSEYQLGSGKVLLFNVAPVLSWTDFPVKGLFAPLLNKSVYYLSSASEPTEKYLCGDDIPVNISGIKTSNIKVIRPDNTEEYLNIDSVKMNKFFIYSNAQNPGIYNFYEGDRLIQTSAVNFDPRESILEKISDDKINELFSQLGFDNFVVLSPDDNISESVNQARFGSELWRLFLIIALILVLIEMMVAKSAKKDIAQT